MPPILPRKRLRSESPRSEPPAKRATRHARARRGKESVFQTLDAPPTISRSLSKTKALLEEDGDSELSELESSEDEFEDVVINVATNGATHKGKEKAHDTESSGSSDEEEWEDALGRHHHHRRHEDEPAPKISGDIELTLSSTATQSAFASRPDGKKGASKIERQIRNLTHCMHVQFLMFHNLVRNSWIQDQQLQKILVENMTTGCWRELDQYWRNAGISDGPSRIIPGGWSKKIAKELDSAARWKDTGKDGVQEYTPSKEPKKGKGRPSKADAKSLGKPDRSQRDWGSTSDRLEPNAPNLSSGDPLLRVLKYLAVFWKSKFKITAPCLRKRGYLSPASLQAEIQAWKQNFSNADNFGERVESLDTFRDMARKCQGSRDVGQQLFTALLRGLGIEARMVASLQPAGFGWSQAEEGKAKDLETLYKKAGKQGGGPSNATTPSKPGQNSRNVNGTRGSPIDLSDEDSSDLSSVISISSASEAEKKSTKKASKVRKYGEELPHPTYWTEAISHLTHTPICVSPFPRSTIATSSNPDLLVNFYCRGAAADKAKQVFAYLIAFSSDGTAKDVTTRYLPKHQWPGRTKGFRMSIEKIPIYNKRGKVKKWEEWDWFKSVLGPYARGISKRQPWDEIEDEGDLVAKKPEKPKDMDEEGGKETLQGYKNSAEYVLERHLRREEALKPGAKTVRYFTTGKGDNEKKEPVYFRKDIVSCKTVESWHKEGRAIKEGEQPLKYVPMRAVTVTRKREIEEREREEGGKVKQGLYSKAQTDWIIPDPIQDGKIPRNVFGNIDVYVPTMIPRGSVHIPLKGTARVCKKLGVDFAEACTGFEFGKQRAVPVLTGVVVAAENEDMVIDAWEVEQAEKAKKEEDKRQKLVLGLWKKFYGGLRIVERMKREYGEDVELPAVATKPTKKKSEWDTFKSHGEDFEGGFVRDDAVGASSSKENVYPGYMGAQHDADMAGGFLPASQEEHRQQPTELTIDHGDDERPDQNTAAADTAYRTPISLHSALQNPLDEEMELDEEENDEDDESVAPATKPRTNRRPRGKAPVSRSRGRSRGSKSTSTARKKPPIDSASDDEPDNATLSSPPSTPTSASEPEAELDHDVEASSPEKPSPPLRKRKLAVLPTIATRATPKRRAARKSDDLVKSHYFATSDEETDLSPQKPSRGRGRGGGRQGRGRGRGRPKRVDG
ncbi:Rad4-domain-containing protein [Lophiostoma macrostomum CBS 122681]|uniref:Rad4-domain-containing protein n=1 Tax=Lophiostoma macrostomum CBS 122681 TaxID=1314788 RepID=A0A6A6T8I4_9PLEO|nr:Rad4-domain-containing protein [Lophiostoma macrostomum CBS 122681]